MLAQSVVKAAREDSLFLFIFMFAFDCVVVTAMPRRDAVGSSSLKFPVLAEIALLNNPSRHQLNQFSTCYISAILSRQVRF